MKKITSFLLLFMLFVGMGHAEKVNGIENVATAPGHLVSGYYLIKNVNAARHTDYYLKFDINNANKYITGAKVNLQNSAAAAEGGYVWYVEKTADGKFLISTADKSKYWYLPKRGKQPVENNKNNQLLQIVTPVKSNFTDPGEGQPGKEEYDNFVTGFDLASAGEPSSFKYVNAGEIKNAVAYTAEGYQYSTYRANSDAECSLGGWDGFGSDQLIAEFYAVDYTAPAEPQSPIKSSTLTADGKHFDQMHWYTLKLHDKTAIYEYFSGKTYLDNFYANKKTANKLFAFVGTKEGGYEIYNCVTGPDKILWSEKAEHKPILMTAKAEGQTNTKWIIETNTTGGFTLVKEGAGNENACINDFSNNGYLAYWTSKDAHNNGGSKITFTEVPASELTEYFNNYKNELKQTVGCVGGLPVTDSEIEAGVHSLNELGEFCNKYTRIAYVDNGLYYIRSQRELYNGTTDQSRFGHHLITTPTAAADGTIADTESNLNVTTQGHVGDLGAIWKLEGNSTCKIKNINCGKTLNRPVDGVLKCNGDVSFNLVPSRQYCGVFSIKINNENNYFHDNNQNENIMQYNQHAEQDFGSAYSVIPVKDITVNVSDAKWATICLPMAVTVPSTGVKVYYVSSVVNDVIYVEQITDVIPAQTPVLLFSETAQAYQFPVSATAGTPLAEGANKLFGKTVKTVVAADQYYGLIKNAANATVFAPYTSTAIPANKVLLPKSAVPAQSQHFQEFRIDFGEPTGIESMEMNNGKSNVYYDLNGRRVLYPTQGIYVNGNGQKVFIK